MAPAATTSTTAASATKTASKPTKSKVIILKLSSTALSQFPSTVEPSRKPSQSRSKSASSSNPPVTPAVEPTPAENPPDATPAPAAATGGTNTPSSLAPPAPAPKKKGVPGPKPGTKRGAATLTPEGLPKPRGKPGPKKKPRLGDLINDPLSKGPFAAPAPIQKLGPKANQGAINAGLRALDRSGKPCRKWEKKGFQLKSFTGVQWTVPTWRAPKRSTVEINGEVKSDTASSADVKLKDESSALSEKSNSGADGNTPLPPQPNTLPSSPAPLVAAT